jgi:hypothetical protein
VPSDSGDLLSGWMETTRTRSHQVDGEEERVTAQRATARRNLAALVVDLHGGLALCKESQRAGIAAAQEFAELGSMLGLDPPSTRKPGTCQVCSRPLPATTSARIASSQVRRDVCARTACKKAVTR